jgi:hypothetical protein
MGRFIFYFASQAYYDEGHDAFPANGVQTYGDLVHKYKIPVTWFTNTEGARRGKDIFEKFHKEFGDDVIVWGMPSTKGDTGNKRDYVLSMNQQQISKYLMKEQAGVKAILPWANVDHIAFFYRTPAAMKAMEELGVKSCYGHCWEMIATDGVTDNGVPWGLYYMDPEKCWKRSAQTPEKSKIIANEWLQHDLNKSWNFYGSCSVFSFDPNDVERAKICDGRSIEYWKEGFREYYRNRPWNDFIPFVLHQEAHEQESTPGGWEVYDQATVDNTYEMTDEFLKFITSGEFPDMEIMSLVQTVEEYRKFSTITPSTYMLFKDIPIDMPVWNKNKQIVYEQYQEAKVAEEDEGETFDIETDYQKFSYLRFPYGWQGMVYGPEKRWPESFVACELTGQFFFHRSINTPIKIWNYLKEIDLDPKNLYFNSYLFQEKNGPVVKIPDSLNNIINSKSRLTEIIEIESLKNIPYALCLWGDFSPFEITMQLCSDVNENLTKIKYRCIGNELLYLYIMLSPGKNLVQLQLKKK